MSSEPEIRRIRAGDALPLACFYNGLATRSKRTFRPLGERTEEETCEGIVQENAVGSKYDLVAVCKERIVGWGFLWDLAPGSTPTFGLGVADAFQGQGLGSRLMGAIMQVAVELGVPRISLTVVQDNAVAWRLYEKQGFVRCGEFVGQDGLPYYRMCASPGPGAWS